MAGGPLARLKRFGAEWTAVERLKSLPAAGRTIVFYAEGAADWAYLGPIVEELVGPMGRTVCYVTSAHDDPVLERTDERLSTFCVGSGALLTALFKSIEAKVMVMTLPDLETYHLKRSLNPVRYAYVFHCINSTHMVYRKGAFDAYDTVLCVGPHHVEEIRKNEEVYGLAPKKLVEHGYGRLDVILAGARARPARPPDGSPVKHVLVAPSWGACSLLEHPSHRALFETLLGAGHRVTLRLHPMTVRHHPELGARITRELGAAAASPERFRVETNMSEQESLQTSDVMISDWSGAAFDYAFGLERPVLFVNTPMKVNNPEYEKLGVVPLEVKVRPELGDVVEPDRIGAELLPKIERLTTDPAAFRELLVKARNKWIFNVGTSGRAGAIAIAELADMNH